MNPASVRPITPAKPESAAEAAYDAALVRRFNEGDESAFIEIMRRYHNRLFSLAHNLLRNAADAEEIVQDAFIRAHRGLANFRGDSSLATWLYRIALNLSRNRYWYFFRRRRQDSLSLEHPLSDESDATFSELIATGEAGDEEMAARIETHRAERPPEWTTVEEPVEIRGALEASSAESFVILDCLSLWVSNLIGRDWDDEAIETEAVRVVKTAASRRA